MSVKEGASHPSYLYTPEQLRRIRRRRGRTSTSLRITVLVKNAHKTEKLQRLERRRQHAAEKAKVSAWWNAQKAQSLKESPSPTPTDSSSASPPLPKVNWGKPWTEHDDPSYYNSEANDQDEEDKENDHSERNALRMPELDLQHVEGDVIAVATDHSVIVHACNTLGAWGSGVAHQLKQEFPAAYAVYAEHCKDNYPADLLGTCLLIPPQKEDIEKTKPIWIACLFTSVGYGRPNKKSGKPGVSSKEDIIKATGPALLGMLLEWSAERKQGEADREAEEDLDSPDSAIFSPKFNAGSFGVQWTETEELIKQKWGGVSEAKWTVVSPKAV